MPRQSLINGALILIIMALSIMILNLHNRLQQAEGLLNSGNLSVESVSAKQLTVINPNGLDVIKLTSDPQDSSGYGDGVIFVDEGQGLENQQERLTASVQIRANASVGGMVAAQSHRVFKPTEDGRLKLEPIHDLP